MNDAMSSDDTQPRDDSPFTPPPPRPWWPWAVPLVVAAAVAGYWWWPADEPEAAPAVSAETTALPEGWIHASDVPDAKHVPLYHCRSSAGQFFWSRKTCNEWGAKLERTTGVPEGMSFEQQVNWAEQRRQEEGVQPPPSSAAPSSVRGSTEECLRLDREIANIDSMARQVLDYTQQDRLRAARKRARDRQFAIGCGRP